MLTPGSPTARHHARTRRHPPTSLGLAVIVTKADVLSVVWLLIICIAFLSPALWQGISFGPFDLASSSSGLIHAMVGGAHNSLSGDQVSEILPWSYLNWQAIHHGYLPLWNPWSALGIPQFLNFQSATFSFPNLISYLAPLKGALLTAVAVKLLVAGTGTYVAARVVTGVGPLPAALAATGFELCGAFALAAPWPLADVSEWTGWVLTFAYLTYRKRSLVWPIALAVCLAFAVYGGSPEMLVLVLLTVTLLLVATAINERWKGARANSSLIGASIRLSSAVSAAAALSSPLWLPGIQVIAASARARPQAQPDLPLSTVLGLIIPGYYGSPLKGSTWFGPFNFYATSFYVGAPILLFAIVALIFARRERATLPLGVACLLLVFLTWELWPIPELLKAVPSIAEIKLWRSSYMLSFALCLLGGLGAEKVLALRDSGGTSLRISLRGRRSAERASATLLCLAGACVFFVLALFALDGVEHLSSLERTVRRNSLYWPLGVSIGLVVLAGLAGGSSPRRRRAVVVGVILLEGAFLLSSGVRVNTYGTSYFPKSIAIAKLENVVGSSVVGLDGGQAISAYPGIGLLPETNVPYGMGEMAAYDPLVPSGYFSSWDKLSGASSASSPYYIPNISSASRARYYGIRFILAAKGERRPAGTQRVAALGTEVLYRVPNSGRFVLSTTAGTRKVLTGSVLGTAKNSWSIEVPSNQGGVLYAGIGALPGWKAFVDGRRVPISPWHGVMYRLVVPKGSHLVSFRYFPPGLEASFGLASVALAILLIGLAYASWDRLGPKVRPPWHT